MGTELEIMLQPDSNLGTVNGVSFQIIEGYQGPYVQYIKRANPNIETEILKQYTKQGEYSHELE